jgi:probable F420-dependent oxidoreductase
MEYGIVFANVVTFAEAEGARTLAAAAEEAGFESLWTVEHVVVPSGYQSAYPYSATGKMPGPEDSPIPDPLIWLAYVAAASTTIKLATGILILPQRNPVVTAKELATLDRLSGGRLMLGVGVGWLEEEFDALGVPFERRGARTDEYIRALRTLWTEEKATFDGEFVSFTDCILRPQPTNGTVPIHIGGHTDRAARRAGELGDGFFPGSSSPDDLAALLEVMRSAAEAAGRDPDSIEVTAGGATDPDSIKRLADLGVSRMIVGPPGFDAEGVRTGLAKFGDEVISRHG